MLVPAESHPGPQGPATPRHGAPAGGRDLTIAEFGAEFRKILADPRFAKVKGWSINEPDRDLQKPYPRGASRADAAARYFIEAQAALDKCKHDHRCTGKILIGGEFAYQGDSGGTSTTDSEEQHHVLEE